MMSQRMAQVHEMALEYDKKLRADDPRFRHTVIVQHEDGTFLKFEHAFALVLTHDEVLDDRERQALAYWDEEDAKPDDISMKWPPDPMPDLARHEIGWLIVFAEHHGVNVYARGDLHDYCQYLRVDRCDEMPMPPY